MRRRVVSVTLAKATPVATPSLKWPKQHIPATCLEGREPHIWHHPWWPPLTPKPMTVHRQKALWDEMMPVRAVSNSLGFQIVFPGSLPINCRQPVLAPYWEWILISQFKTHSGDIQIPAELACVSFHRASSSSNIFISCTFYILVIKAMFSLTALLSFLLYLFISVYLLEIVNLIYLYFLCFYSFVTVFIVWHTQLSALILSVKLNEFWSAYILM